MAAFYPRYSSRLDCPANNVSEVSISSLEKQIANLTTLVHQWAAGAGDQGRAALGTAWWQRHADGPRRRYGRRSTVGVMGAVPARAPRGRSDQPGLCRHRAGGLSGTDR